MADEEAVPEGYTRAKDGSVFKTRLPRTGEREAAAIERRARWKLTAEKLRQQEHPLTLSNQTNHHHKEKHR